MTPAKLQEYVDREFERGVNQSDLIEALKKEGWKTSQIENAINKSSQNMQKRSVSQDIYVKNQSPDKNIKKRINLPRLILIAAVLFLLASVALVASSRLTSRSTQTYIEQMVVAMQSVDSFSYEGTLNYSSDTSLVETGENSFSPIPAIRDLDLILNGAIQGIQSQSKSYLVKAKVDSDRFFVGEAEIMLIPENKYYVKLYDLGMFEGVGLEPIKNVWILMDEQSTNFDQVQNTEIFNNLAGQLTTSFSSGQVFTKVDNTGNDNINGHDVVVLSYELDGDYIKTVLRDFINANSEQIGFDQDQINVFNQDIEELVIQKASGELWIDKESYLLRKMTLNLQTQSQTYGSSALSLQFTLDAFNSGGLVVEPVDYTTSDEIVSQMQASLLPDNTELTQEEDQQIQDETELRLDGDQDGAFLPQGF